MLGEDFGSTEPFPVEVKSKLDELNGYFFDFNRANRPPTPKVLLDSVRSLINDLEGNGYYPSFMGSDKGFCLKKEKSLNSLTHFESFSRFNGTLDVTAKVFKPSSKK